MLIDVNIDNVSETGFFCYMSQKKSVGYQKKLAWLRSRFAEGLQIKMLGQGQRGFIEYIPGEYAWRAVHADGYMMIHCLWVVGKSKGKGYGSALLDACIKDANKAGMKGVAAVVSQGNWLIGRKILKQHGFKSVGQAPPAFELMVMPFGNAPLPTFVEDWDQKSADLGKGLTIVSSAQCPYLEKATSIIQETAGEIGIKHRVIELESSQEVRRTAPSAYGVFNVVYNGQLISYHYLTKKELFKKLESNGT